MQQHKKQHVREKEIQQLKLQQEKNLQQNVNAVHLQSEVQHENQHEELQKDELQEELQEEDNLFFSFFYLNYRMLILSRNFRA